MITKVQIEETEWQEFFKMLEEIHKNVLLNKPKNSTEWITGGEVQKLLNIGSRCLQDYRDSGKIGFSQIGKKVILYKMADVEDLLKNNYNKPFKN